MVFDAIGAASSAASLAGGFWQFLSFVREVRGAETIAARFDAKGDLLSGNEKIAMTRLIDDAHPNVWYYRVDPVEGYTFLRFPVTEGSAVEEIGRLEGEQNPDARVWRYLTPAYAQRSALFTTKDEAGNPQPLFLPNLLVEFVVVGYRPDALVGYLSGGS